MATKAADNRWSRVKWGQTKWGASTAKQTLAWGLEVDWNGDGLFENNEANRMVGISGFRGRTSMLRAVGSGVEPLRSGTYTFTLDNWDGRYDAWNSSSALYPNVTYGKDVRLRVRDMNGSASAYPVFYGIITDIIPHRDLENNAQVQLVVEDSWVYLRNNKPRVVINASITTDAAMNLVLASINWPARWGRALDASSDTISYYWALANQSAGQAVEDLANSGIDSFFISADGKATYIIRSDIPAATLSISQDMVYKDIQIAQPWVNQRNVIRLTVNPRSQAASGVIWQLIGNAPSIAAGATLKFFAPYTYSNVACPANTVLQPVATTDWTTNTAANGSGTDKTANCSLTITDFGDTALVTVVNNDAGLVYLTKAQIKGRAIYVTNAVDVTYPSDATTITNPRELKQDLPWQQDVNVAQSIVTVLGPFYGTQFPVVTCRMSGRPSEQFLLDLYDTVTVTFTQMGLTGQSFRVAGIAMDSQDSACQDIITTLYLEPYATILNAAVYDTSVYDTGVYGW